MFQRFGVSDLYLRGRLLCYRQFLIARGKVLYIPLRSPICGFFKFRTILDTAVNLFIYTDKCRFIRLQYYEPPHLSVIGRDDYIVSDLLIGIVAVGNGESESVYIAGYMSYVADRKAVRTVTIYG